MINSLPLEARIKCLQIRVEWIVEDASFTTALEHILAMQFILSVSQRLQAVMVSVVIKQLFSFGNRTIHDHAHLQILRYSDHVRGLWK